MEIRIESPQFPLWATTTRYLRRRLGQDLAGYDGRIREVRAQLTETRTTYSGVYKGCRLVVRLMRGGEIAEQSFETDLFMSIRMAADRLHRRLQRRLARRRDSGGEGIATASREMRGRLPLGVS